MITLNHVSYQYPNTTQPALSEVSLHIAPGELKLVTGVSGCGKTTLMRLVNGLIPHLYAGSITGDIKVNGQTPSETSLLALSTQIGTLFQDPEEQFFALNVYDEIAFTLKNQALAPDEIDSRVRDVAQTLGLSAILTSDIHTLSEGQKQKVGLAALLVHQPKVLVLDEPTANLDPEAIEELGKILGELKQKGTAILVVDHRLYWLKTLADEVLVMSEGRVVARGDWAILNDTMSERYGLRLANVTDVRQTLPRVCSDTVSPPSPPGEEAHQLHVHAMRFAYPNTAPLFHGVTFTLNAGMTALIGANGKGKTTLARILCGLNTAQGDFYLDGKKTTPQALMAHVGLVLQNADHQLQMRTVKEEIATALAVGQSLVSRPSGFPKRTPADDDHAQTWIDRLNLTGLESRHPQSLSGGQKQRVVIACALAKQPDILILDEPTSGLDGANMRDIARVLQDCQSQGMVVIVITHDLELLSYCQQVLSIADFTQA